MAHDLFESVCQELRQVASFHMTYERIGHTLNPTSLVHEAYLRLTTTGKHWANRKQFFIAASEAMRHILVDHARFQACKKRMGSRVRQPLAMEIVPAKQHPDNLAMNDALEVLAAENPEAAELVKLRYFAGLTRLRQPTFWN